MSPRLISHHDVDPHLTWEGLTNALMAGHARPKATIKDTFLYRGDDTMLSRAAWIDGLGLAVKTATIFPGNKARGLHMIDGAVSFFSDEIGTLDAVIDFHLVTKWKTAGDSLLAAKHLARPDSETILIVGAGEVATNLRSAYGSIFPGAQFKVWSRTSESARALADRCDRTEAVLDLEAAVRSADIVTCATMTTEPIIQGAWLRPGTHLDLIGAYRPDMREADDAALLKGRIFVDSFETTLDHIGELKIPISQGVLAREAVLADFYDLAKFQRQPEDITVFKNGGGAHLDVMTSAYILDTWKQI